MNTLARWARNLLPAHPCPWCGRREWDRVTGAGLWWDCTRCGIVYDPGRGRWRAHLGTTWWR